jgi:hypothetical protein
MSQSFSVEVEVFDGALSSTSSLIVTCQVIYDPPVLSGPLVARSTTVPSEDRYTLPKSVNGRNTQSGVLQGPNFPSWSSITNDGTYTYVVSKPGFTIPAETIQINLIFTADNNNISDSFTFTVYN